MVRAFEARDDCPEVPDIEEISFDMAIDCSPLPVPLPFCEAPESFPPLALTPVGCVCPTAGGNFTMLPSGQPPSLDFKVRPKDDDCCNLDFNMDIGFPLWNCWGINTAPAEVTLSPEGKAAFDLDCSVDERAEGTTDCPPPLCIPKLTLPCPTDNITVTSSGGGSLTVTQTPGRNCFENNLNFDIKFPELDLGDFGICSVTATVTQDDDANGPSARFTPRKSAGATGGTFKVRVNPGIRDISIPMGTKFRAGSVEFVTTGTARFHRPIDSYDTLCPGVRPIVDNILTLDVIGTGANAGSCDVPPEGGAVTWLGAAPAGVVNASVGSITCGSPECALDGEDCEWTLAINIPKVKIGTVHVDVELKKEVETRFRANRSNTAEVSGASGGGSGGGSGDGGAAPDGSGIGDDRPCTDLFFKKWVNDPSPGYSSVEDPSNPRPPNRPEHPDQRSLFYLSDDPAEAKLTQTLEPTFNREPKLQMNVCRRVEENPMGGEDCVLDLDARLAVPCTAFRMYARRISAHGETVSWHAGREYKSEDRFREEMVAPPPTSFTPNRVIWNADDNGDGIPNEYDPLRPQTADTVSKGFGGCGEAYPADIGILDTDDPEGGRRNRQLQQFSEQFNFGDFEPIEKDAAGGTLMFNGMPLFRLVRPTGDGAAHFWPEDVDGRVYPAGTPAEQIGKPEIKLTGGFYITADEAALEQGRCQMDIRSDLELVIPHGKTRIVPVAKDFVIDDATGRIFVLKELMVVFDGMVSQVIGERDYSIYDQDYDEILKQANNGAMFEILANDAEDEWLDAGDPGKGRKFKFRQEILNVPCGGSEENG